MSKYVNINRGLFVACSVVGLLISCGAAEAKIFTLGGNVIAKTEKMNARPGLQAREMKLTAANFAGADLTDADFAGADLRRADFSGANLEGANFVGADIRGADFSGANLDGANFAKADLRGAAGFQIGRDTITTNTILPNGVIRDLNLCQGETLVVRNYDAVRDSRYSGAITLTGIANIDGGKIIFVVDNQNWNSVIRLAQGVIPSVRDLDIRCEAAHSLVTPDRNQFRPFSWLGVSEVGFGQATVSDALALANN